MPEQQTRPARRRGNGLTAAKVAQLGLRQIADLTGKDPAGVVSVESAEEGWTIGVEVVEDKRIPSSTDMLAIYQADLDETGELQSYRRLRRYSRGSGDSDDNDRG
ncbi:MAG TPA: gas vesicle protein GvpO [Streptosporangiaceae bacterium]